MPRNANQRLVDALTRHQVYLVGHAKSVAAKLQATLDATSPEMREHLLKTFASNDTDTQTIKKLRAAEAKLLGIRGPAWSNVREQLIDALADLANNEPDFLHAVVSRIRSDANVVWNSPAGDLLRGLASKTLLAGRTLAELVTSIRSSDLARIAGQTRIGYFARETASKLAARVLGTAKAISPTLAAAANALDTLVSTAVHAVASAARELSTKINRRKGGFSDIEIWISILDLRTTDGCRKLHHQLFHVGFGIMPGYHYHCRSDRVPYLEGEPPPDALSNFADWAEAQGAKFKKFLKNTKVFQRSNIKPLTLEEVQRLDNEME